MEETQGHSEHGRESMLKRMARVTWLATYKLLDYVMDVLEDDWEIVLREADLFAGALLVILGLLNFQSSKYCDGNAADYLSCTQPTTYYYYNGLEVALVIIGVVFILLWFMKRRGK